MMELLDWASFREHVNTHRSAREYTWADVALATSVPAHTLSRLQDGKRITRENCNKLCQWMSVPIERFFREPTLTNWPDQTPPKRVTISMPAKFWEIGRIDAERRGISLSDWCTDAVIEYAEFLGLEPEDLGLENGLEDVAVTPEDEACPNTSA